MCVSLCVLCLPFSLLLLRRLRGYTPRGPPYPPTHSPYLVPASFFSVLLLRVPRPQIFRRFPWDSYLKNFSRHFFRALRVTYIKSYDSHMAEKKKKDSRLERAGVSGYNKPKRTPNHPKKSHIVVAKEGDKIKTIRFGQQGVKTAGKPKKGESAKQKARRKSFKARHGRNIKKGKMSAAYWADKVKW